MTDRITKYLCCSPEDRLWQGEILSGLIQTVQRLSTIGAEVQPILDETEHPFTVVLTQDCDLENDFERRASDEVGTPPLPSVLFCEVITTKLLKGLVTPGKDIWKRIIQNKDERYHCLERVPKDADTASTGIDSLGVDFKRYFTLSTSEVYMRIEIGQIQRRSRLMSPYAEHLASRFSYFQSRIALPENHDVSL